MPAPKKSTPAATPAKPEGKSQAQPAAKPAPKPTGGSAKGLLRGLSGMGMVGGSGSFGPVSTGPASAAGAKDTHSPFNSGAMQAQKAASQNTKANAIQGRKAPGA